MLSIVRNGETVLTVTPEQAAQRGRKHHGRFYSFMDHATGETFYVVAERAS